MLVWGNGEIIRGKWALPIVADVSMTYELVMRGARYNVTNRRRNQNRLKAPRHEKRKASVHEIYGGD